MKTKNSRLFCLIISFTLIFCLCLCPSVNQAQAYDQTIQSRAALLMEAHTGEIIFAHNEHEKLFPAIVSKIITLLLALEALKRGEIDLHDEVPV